MLRKVFMSLLIGSMMVAPLKSKGYELKPKWCLDLMDIGYKTVVRSEAPNFEIFTTPTDVWCLGRFLVFFGPIGLGTAIIERYGFWEYEDYREFTIQDTLRFVWSIGREEWTSYFPIIIYSLPYSKQLRFGDLNLYGYLKSCVWTSTTEYEVINQFTSEQEGSLSHYFSVYKHPRSYLDVGICISFNPLRFVPFWLRLGIQRLDYGYIIPPPFKKHKVPVPSPILTRFYVSYGLSIGYWGIK